MIDYASPFATSQTHTYRLDDEITVGVYVEPEPPDRLPDGVKPGDPIGFNYASLFDVPQEIAETYWVTLRLPTSRADNSAVEGAGEPGTPEWRKTLLLQLCEGWSISSKPTGDEYDRLQAWVYRWLDACVVDALSRGVAGRAEKKGGPVRSPGRSRAKSTRARSQNTA